MNYRLLMAMSTLPAMVENEFVIEAADEPVTIENCISQLEPTAKYIINKFGKELELLILCTEQTVKAVKDNVEGRQHTAISFFVSRILQHIDCTQNLSEEIDKFMPENIKMDTDYIYGDLRFRFVSIDDTAPKAGIEKVVEHIKNNRVDNKNFWIDTHGGFRDTAFVLNAIISLLKVYDIKPGKIVGVRYATKDEGSNDDNVNKIIDQRKSFEMVDFVSGMNEFIQFGSADSLVEYFKDNNDPSVKKLISAMKIISDGTRLCDPTEYIKGLDDLGGCINSIQSDDEFITVFVDYIKADYGELLDRATRTPLNIIKRCYRKKLYQQALTFIESLMPEEFVRKKVLYYDVNDAHVFGAVGQIKQKMQKDYVSDAHFVFDSYIFTLDKYYYDEDKDWSEERHNRQKQIDAIVENNSYGRTLSDDKKKKIINDLARDYKAISAINKKSVRILGNYFEDSHILQIKNRSQLVGEIELFTDVKSTYSDIAGKLFRLHKAIKQCRNLTNHAAEKFRPSVEDISKGIELYIMLTEKLLNSKALIDRAPLVSTGKTYVVVQSNNNDGKKKNHSNKKNGNNNNNNKNNNNGNNNNSGKNNNKSNSQAGVKSPVISDITISEVGKNHTLKGTLTDGKKGVIPRKFVEGLQANDFMGKVIKVSVKNENGGIWICEPVGKLTDLL